MRSARVCTSCNEQQLMIKDQKRKSDDYVEEPTIKRNRKQNDNSTFNDELNAFLKSSTCPKTPLTVFTELFPGVHIHSKEYPQESGTIFYIASIEMAGMLYIGHHVNQTTAKHIVCEKVLRAMMAEKIKNPPCGVGAKPQDDFPWNQFISLAMHNLINRWDLQSTQNEATNDDSQPKVDKWARYGLGNLALPEHPEQYSPVQLLRILIPNIKFKIIESPANWLVEVHCEMEGVKCVGKGFTITEAKRQCAVKSLIYFWNFNYDSLLT